MAHTISSSSESGDGIILENDSMTMPGGSDLTAGEFVTKNASPATITGSNGDVLLANAMPQAEYMYGCTPTAVGMILGYYDLYGYRGTKFTALIDGDVDVQSRGTDGNAYNMDAFDTVLGRAIASTDYVYRFFSRGDLDIITQKKAGTYWTTSGKEELEYSFVNGGEGPEIRTDVWNCIADYLGTGQAWRGNDNLSTTITQGTLETVLNYEMNITYIDGDIQRTVDCRYTSMLYGLFLYVESKGYSLDRKITGTFAVDVAGGDFTFEDYKAEIDAGRPVLISLEGHSMVGYGYNPETNEIIFDDCYQADQRMVWDGTYHYSEKDLPLQSMTVIGLMAGGDVDLTVNPVTVDSVEMFLAADSVPLASGDYCYPGSSISVNFTVSNLGTSPCGAFTVSVYVDGELSTSIDVSSLEADSSEVYTDIPLNGLALGLHTIRVVADDASVIQELSALNNAMEQKLMVLKEDANVVTGIKQVGPGEISRDDYISSGWQMHILSGGTASATIVRGIVTDVASNGTIFYLPGIAVVSQGGLVQDVAVYEYGQIQVSGTAGDLHVYENGSIMVFSGGRITGTLTVGNGAVVSMEDGSILDFDLTRTMAGNAALVNDLSAIQGAPLYSLTVDTNLKPGKSVYLLAEGAGGFNSAISVINAAGNELGSLSLGETVRIGDDDYTLSLTGAVLSVTVVAPVPLPVNLNGGSEQVSWDTSGAEQYIVEFSTDSFLHVIRVITTENTVDMMDLPAGTYQWRVKADVGSEWAVGAAIVSKANSDTPKVLRSDENGNCDLFFAEANSTWENFYYARHVGSINDWTGTDEMVSASGKGRIQNLFFGSADPNVLCLMDSENGDALFVDDIYTELPEGIEKNLSRLCRIREVRAGAGDDIMDMTSQRFEYVGDGLTIRGGDGDDTIWANKGDNFLFGDAGNDRIVGASGDDVIAGGIGSDSMHGGGGKDTFTFCGNWGSDEVEQLETGLVTLWFASGSMANWNENTLTYTDGINSVTVSGVTANKITLKFGDDGSKLYAALASAGAFAEFTSQRIFEESGILASL